MSKKSSLMENNETYRKIQEMHKKAEEPEEPTNPKVLIIPDIAGWVMETFTDNIIRVLKHKFDFTKVIAEAMPRADYLDYLHNHKSEFDVIYVLLPGYLPDTIEDKFITSFHGGPGVEGQADQIERYGMCDMPISFVSYQVKARVVNQPWKSNRRVAAPLKNGISLDYEAICREQGLKQEYITNIKVEPNAVPRIDVNLHVKKPGFGLTSLHFTPYGVNPDEYKRTQAVNQNKLICGYAGWLKYITGGQPEHRRTGWILSAQDKMNFDLELAAGLEQYNGQDVHKYRESLRMNRMNKISAACYSKIQMQDFYSKINCYLVPDARAGGPMPVLEAGLLEVPPVTTDCGLCGDIVTHMENGYLVNSQEEFEQGIRFMRENPEERIRMGKNMKKYILENRTWEKVAPVWESFFNVVQKKFNKKYMR